LNAGVGTIAINVVKSDRTTELIHLRDVLYYFNFTTNVICQWPFKRGGVYYHSGKDMLTKGKTEKELVYLPKIDRIPNFLVVDHPKDALAALAYASLVAY
jgi:hypothetical protein